jgi:ketosteroid isomerase-like protein
VESARATVVRRIWKLFNSLDPDEAKRRASTELRQLAEFFHPDVEFSQPAVQIDADEFSGRGDFLDSWNEWLNLWQVHRSEITGIEERGESVLVTSHERYKGRDGLKLERDVASIFTIRGGRIVRFRAFFDEASAREEFADMPAS